MNVVTTKKLCFSYDKKGSPILSDLSLSFPRGSVTAILGPNGAGKTTLLYCLLGILKPDTGIVSLFEVPLNQFYGSTLKRKIGIVVQNETVPFDLQLSEYVLLGRAPYLHLLEQPSKQDKTIAEESIGKIGMARFTTRVVPSLSSGEKQLAAIARLLVQSPEIMLFDEPTSHLDISNSRRVLSLMKGFAKEEKTVIFTTHDPNSACMIADYIILLGREKLIASGSPEDVMTEKNIYDTFGIPVEVIKTERGIIVYSFIDR